MVGDELARSMVEAWPWLAAPLASALASQRGHALLVCGPEGVGQFELAHALAQAWLCETPLASGPCGHCAACRLVQARTHPDLLLLLPEALRVAWGWDAEAESASSGSKAKPSKEIKVDAVRGAVGFAQTTSARGRGKVVVVHPADRMNGVAANTLLKTLEEPPGDARFLLVSSAPDRLLPTLRSRCQLLRLAAPAAPEATAWLQARGMAEPAVLLAAAGGQPQEALAWLEHGVDAAQWRRLPERVAQGDASAVAGWPLPRLVDAMQKLCHDANCVAHGAAPRFFPAAALPSSPDAAALAAWDRELLRIARHAEHPWNAGLLAESLIALGRRALAGGPTLAPATARPSLHSAR